MPTKGNDKSTNKVEAIGDPGNGGAPTIAAGQPVLVGFTLEGVSPLLFHRWDVESVELKAAASKGSAAKKTDDINSYVWRLDDGTIGIPGEYVRQSMIMAAKFRQDPRSPRKSAMDLYKATLISLTDLASLGTDTWDYLDRRRVTVQRSGITRVRPAFRAGWRADFEFMINLPEYVGPMDFLDVLVNAGRFVGVGDFRPSFGRFAVPKFEVLDN